jgi:hypothetical protein
MTVKIYVSKDSTGKEWGPDYSHEMEGIIELLQKLWMAYNHLPQLYAVVANLRQPSADFVLIAERGLGVLDLKHYPGNIRIESDGQWYADTNKVKGGVNNPTPHLQVQSYAKDIRARILRDILPAWLKTTPPRWSEMKFQTAICFTNPAAKLEGIENQVKTHQSIRRTEWEDSFSVFKADGIVPWVAKLRFGVNYGREKNFEPYRLHPIFITRLVTQIFGGTEWKEILPSMPTGEPYAYVHRHDADGEATYNLLKETVVIGRNPDCDIVIPSDLKRVSRRHCQIVRRAHGIEIEDLGSSHGTYVDGQLISEALLLSHGQQISLGGVMSNERTCVLRFESREQTSLRPSSTDISDDPLDTTKKK